MDLDLVIIGSSGHASDLVGVIESTDLASRRSTPTNVGILVDEQYRGDLERLGPGRTRGLVGTPDDLGTFACPYIIGIGYPKVRKLMFDRVSRYGHRAATLIHPDANVGHMATVGDGTALLAGAQIAPLARIGRHVYVAHLCAIGHHATILDFVSVMPGAVVSGDVEIGAEALVGAHATILEGVKVGPRAVVAAGALVTKDVPADTTVIGIPARARPEG